MGWARKLEQTICSSAGGAWHLLQGLNRLTPAGRPFSPRWADEPLPRGEQRSRPPTGWPRQTDSLCPVCVKQIRQRIQRGELDGRELSDRKPGELSARIVEQGGRILMVKHCPEHGSFEDVLSVDPAFYRRMERLGASRDVRISPDQLHDHGSSTLKYGRGGVLTVDLTNRCNMMCDTCFMDANQVGHVYELDWQEIARVLDDALSVRPRRQLSVQFSGGEPTLSPHFLEAIRYARQLGYFSVQCATNGMRFALEPGFAQQCHDAGLRLAYLQFDGVTNAAHEHRNVGNLLEVKLRAIEELAAADIDVVLVATIIGGVNDDQVGPIVEFAVDNADKITVVSFQPISFTGRNEDISDELRAAQRYTLSHLVHDVHGQTGWTDPLRDWFPLNALAPFGDVVDLMDGTDRSFGHLKCACHAHCGVGTVLFVHKRTGQMIPLTEFLDLEGLLRDMEEVFDAGRGSLWTRAQLAASLLRHFRPERAPEGFGLRQALSQFLSQTGATHAGHADAHRYDWRVLFVAGMWFQDLYNYDFRRTEMCIIPHGTPQGEISFCALNTGVGWRHIVEHANTKASTAEWYRTHGRHPIYADGADVDLPPTDRPQSIREHPLTRAERTAEGEPRQRQALDPSEAPSPPRPTAADRAGAKKGGNGKPKGRAGQRREPREATAPPRTGPR